jgi:hypothetical protein
LRAESLLKQNQIEATKQWIKLMNVKNQKHKPQPKKTAQESGFGNSDFSFTMAAKPCISQVC